MANNEIDSLSFSVNVKGITPKTIEKIQAFSKALQDLNSVVKNIDLSQLDYLQNIDSFTGMNLKSMASGLDKVNNVLKRADFNKLASLKAPITLFQFPKSNAGEMQKQAESTDDLSNSLQKLNTVLADIKKKSGKKGIKLGLNEDVKKEIAENKQLRQVLKAAGILKDDKDKKKGNNVSRIAKTLRRIKLIAFIKLIRGALNAVIKGFQTGIQQLAIYSKDFNSTMTQMTSNFQKINAGLSLVAQPLLEALLPVVQSFTDVLVDLGNALSKANAQAKGLSTYTKVSSKYAKDYAKSMQQGTLFSFDTFNTLNAQESPFEEAKVDEEDNAQASELMETINAIKEAGQSIAEVIKTITPYINKILKFINPILKTIINISNRATQTLLPSIERILDLISSIVEIVAPIINDVLIALEPIIQAINVDLIPPLINLFTDIIKPIAGILKDLPIAEIVRLIAKILVPAIQQIAQIINVIDQVVRPLIDFLTSQIGIIMDLFGDLFALLLGDDKKIDEYSTRIIKNLKKLINSIYKLVVKGIASLVDYFINRFIEAINIIIANDFIKWITNDLLGQNWQGITWRSNIAGLSGDVSLFNDEDLQTSGLSSLNNNSYLANSSNTSQAQLTTAFENAIYNTGLLDSIENAGNISIDGKDIAQSKNFKRELNRTNPKLALK